MCKTSILLRPKIVNFIWCAYNAHQGVKGFFVPLFMQSPLHNDLKTQHLLEKSLSISTLCLWLMSKSIHIVTIVVTILCVAIVVSVYSHTCNYITMDPNFRCACDYHKFRWKYWWKVNIFHLVLKASIDSWC